MCFGAGICPARRELPPQLHNENLKCTSSVARAFHAACFTVGNFLAVGQDASRPPSAFPEHFKSRQEMFAELVHLGWLQAFGAYMRCSGSWRSSGRDQQGAGATSQVHSVSALLFGFLRLIGLVRSQYIPVDSYGSGFLAKSLGSFRSAIARACSHRRIPMHSPPLTSLPLLPPPPRCVILPLVCKF